MPDWATVLQGDAWGDGAGRGAHGSTKRGQQGEGAHESRGGLVENEKWWAVKQLGSERDALALAAGDAAPAQITRDTDERLLHTV